jgi:hypothetical protein
MTNKYVIYTLIVLGVLVLSPLAYIEGFLLIKLPRRCGYLKFFLILICYIVFISALVALLSASYINLIVFIMLLLLPKFYGVYILKEEFLVDIKKIFNLNKRRNT